MSQVGGRGSGTARGRLAVWGEEQAESHYRASGYRILDRNWRCAVGELDLVVQGPGADGPTVFVEVKTRRGTAFGTPLEAVTTAKCRRLRRAAATWLADQRDGTTGRHWAQVRFDVVAVRPLPGGRAELEVVEDAF